MPFYISKSDKGNVGPSPVGEKILTLANKNGCFSISTD